VVLLIEVVEVVGIVVVVFGSLGFWQHLCFLFRLQFIMRHTEDLIELYCGRFLLKKLEMFLFGVCGFWTLGGACRLLSDGSFFSSNESLTGSSSIVFFSVVFCCGLNGLLNGGFLLIGFLSPPLTGAICILVGRAGSFTAFGWAVVEATCSSRGGNGYLQHAWDKRNLQLNFNFKQNLGAYFSGFEVLVEMRFASMFSPEIFT